MAEMRDFVVVLPGITGSVLRKSNADIWALSGGALWSYLRSLGGSLNALRLPRHNPRKEDPADGVSADRLIDGFHGVFGLGEIDGYRDLRDAIWNEFFPKAKRDNPPQNYLEFAYDWRLSSRLNARRLAAEIETPLGEWRTASGYVQAKVILVAHSMGGLVSRYWLEVLEGWRDCRALITFATPYLGSLDAVGYVANGYKKAFADLTDVLRSCPSVYELMPIYNCLSEAGSEGIVAQSTNLPDVFHTDYLQAAFEFHREIQLKVGEHEGDQQYLDERYKVFPVVGVAQPTWQRAQLIGGTITLDRDLPAEVPDELLGGDGTVPLVSATPMEYAGEIKEVSFPEQHGSLQNNVYALTDMVEKVKRLQVQVKKGKAIGDIRGTYDADASAKRTTIGVAADSLFLDDEPVLVTVATRVAIVPSGALRGQLTAVDTETTTTLDIPLDASGHGTVQIPNLPEGRYRLRVESVKRGPYSALPVTTTFEVAGAL